MRILLFCLCFVGFVSNSFASDKPWPKSYCPNRPLSFEFVSIQFCFKPKNVVNTSVMHFKDASAAVAIKDHGVVKQAFLYWYPDIVTESPISIVHDHFNLDIETFFSKWNEKLFKPEEQDLINYALGIGEGSDLTHYENEDVDVYVVPGGQIGIYVFNKVGGYTYITGGFEEKFAAELVKFLDTGSPSPVF